MTSGVDDRRAIVWDSATGRPVRDLRQPGRDDFNEVSAGWSPDGSMVATAGGEGKVVLWRASNWEQLATLQADTIWVSSVAFSPDGSLLAAAGVGDRAVTLWDVAARKLVGRLPHPILILFVAFDPGGETLATSALDGKARLWDIASLRQIGTALPGPENQTNVSGFDPSGNHLITLYETGAGFVWDVDPDRWKARACAVVGRPLTRDEWKELLPSRTYQPACR